MNALKSRGLGLFLYLILAAGFLGGLYLVSPGPVLLAIPAIEDSGSAHAEKLIEGIHTGYGPWIAFYEICPSPVQRMLDGYLTAWLAQR